MVVVSLETVKEDSAAAAGKSPASESSSENNRANGESGNVANKRLPFVQAFFAHHKARPFR